VSGSAGDGASGAEERLGLSGLVQAEQALAARVLRLAARPVSPPSDRSGAAVAAWLAADPEARALSDEQRAAVRLAVTSGLFVLTGGPGVGKTTTLRAAVRCLGALGRSVALAAPTGKAAQRLGQVVGVDGLEASTVHRLLGAGPRGFRHGPSDPLEADVVVVDEASMLDTQLARAVVGAVRPGAQLLLVGDADQLPSVGPGQVLRDLLESGRVPSARLRTVFRQAARSRIVANAHRIREGLPPELAPAEALARGVDCVFLPAPAARVGEVATPWAAQRLPRLLGVPAPEVQVLAPLTRVCQALNAALQATLNPPRGQPERPHGALALRAGDRVIQTRNNYTLGVFNGDTGVVLDVGPQGATVDFGAGRAVEYGSADLIELEHAYCLTVHRAQGSEWPGVVLLASSAYGPMLSRNLLYTALTRARRAAVVIGDEAALVRAVAETRDLHRCTGLGALLTAAAPLREGQDGREGRGAPAGEPEEAGGWAGR
jgi:exodeoxyribonuclease V alpha subunit